MVDALVGETATTIALWLWCIGWAFALARLDIREHRLPNRMVAVCFAIGHVTGGIGMGDFKFALVTGWMLCTMSCSAVWWGHVAAFVLAGVAVTGGCCAGGGASIPSRSDPSWASV